MCTYWAGCLQSIVPLYLSLKWLKFDVTEWPKRHFLLELSGDLCEVHHIAVHLKIVTGTYILQTNRHSFNQNQVDALCLLCKGANETIAHFLLDFTTLETTRQHILKNIKHILRNCGLDLNNSETLLRLLIDCSVRYVLIQIWSFCAGRKTSCSGIFAYVCTEKLSFVDNLRTAQKIHLYRIGVYA